MKNKLLSTFSDHVEDSLEKAVERDSWDRKGKLYVSDLKHAVPLDEGGDCPRKLRAKLEDEPQEALSPGVELMFSTGDALHERVADWLGKEMAERGWMLKEVEVSAHVGIPNSPVKLRGRLDMLFEGEVSEKRIVVDVKTKRGGAFHYLPLSQGKAKRPDELQVQAYMMARDADGGLVLYVDREGQNWIVTAPVERDDEAVREAADYLYGLKHCDVDKIPLVRPKVTRNSNKGPDSIKVEWPWQVDYCPLKKCHCQEDLKMYRLPSGIIGHVDDDGNIEWKGKVKGKTYARLRVFVRENLPNG